MPANPTQMSSEIAQRQPDSHPVRTAAGDQSAPSSLERASSERPAQFEDLQVRVGARIQLIFSRRDRGAALSSTLIGYAAHEFLIVRAPVQGGLAVKVQNDEWFKVRLFTGVLLAEFETAVTRQFVAPASYWHLGYPAVVRISTLRAALRAPVDLAARATCDGQPAPAEVRIVDLNELGAKILAPSVLGARDASLQLEFTLPTGIHGEVVQISVAARIKAIKTIERSGDNTPAHAHGLQFHAVGEREKLLLQNFALLRLSEVRADGA